MFQGQLWQIGLLKSDSVKMSSAEMHKEEICLCFHKKYFFRDFKIAFNAQGFFPPSQGVVSLCLIHV